MGEDQDLRPWSTDPTAVFVPDTIGRPEVDPFTAWNKERATRESGGERNVGVHKETWRAFLFLREYKSTGDGMLQSMCRRAVSFMDLHSCCTICRNLGKCEP